MTVTKKILSKNISNKLGLTLKDSLSLVNIFFKILSSNQGKDINIQNFGSFSSIKTPKRIGRNPKTLQQFDIKARTKLSFSPSDYLKKDLN